MNLNRQEQQCLDMFHSNGNKVTTAMFLNTTLSAEYRKIISRLRNIHGYNIPAPKLNKKEPRKNLYELIEDKKETTTVVQVNDLSKDSKEKCQNPKCGSYFKIEETGECNVCLKKK